MRHPRRRDKFAVEALAMAPIILLLLGAGIWAEIQTGSWDILLTILAGFGLAVLILAWVAFVARRAA